MDSKAKVIGIGIFLYIASALGAYFIFANTVFTGSGGSGDENVPAALEQDGKTVFDDSLPKTEPCPLNGQLFSKQQRQWWEKHRPLGVMIENHEESRPQSGLSDADVVYEALAEGGITRFLAVFYCDDAELVGPVRSARTYFLDFISEYGDYPLYAHVGGANTPGPADALGQIEEYGWVNYNDLNQFSIGFPTFWRDYERLPGVATEHTMYSTTSKLWEVGEKRELTDVDEDGNPWDEGFVAYSFKEEAAQGDRGPAQTIAYDFWDGYSDYSVSWTYDPVTNTYKRNNGGEPHLDKNKNEAIAAKNLVILYMTESRANDGYEGNQHMLYGTEGSGKAVFFMDGERINGKWAKKGRTSRTLLTDNSGKEVELNPGLIWFSILDTTNTSLTDK